MRTVRLEPAGQVVMLCAPGFELYKDYSGTPTYERPMTRREARLLKSFSPVGVSLLWYRVVSVGLVALLIYVSYGVISAIAHGFGVLPSEYMPKRNPVLSLWVLGAGLAVGLVLQYLYSRGYKEESTPELRDVQSGMVRVQQITCRRIIDMLDEDWDSRLGGRGILAEIGDDQYIYLQGRYLDKARKQGVIPREKFEVVRAKESGWGLGITNPQGNRPLTIGFPIDLVSEAADGSYLPFPLEKMEETLESLLYGATPTADTERK